MHFVKLRFYQEISEDKSIYAIVYNYHLLLFQPLLFTYLRLISSS